MVLPPSKDSADIALAQEVAVALFAAAARMAGVGSTIAIIDAAGRAVAVTPFGLTLVGARDQAEFQRLFLSGAGPGARRLRRLAATLGIAKPPQLERIRRLQGSRPSSVNTRCVRIVGPGGAAFLVLAADDAGYRPGDPTGATETDGARRNEVPAPDIEAPRRSRFLWHVDKEGRFGDPDPLLAAALGDHAPKSGETIEGVRLRAGVENGPALATAMEKRQTFSGLTLLWSVGDGIGARPITFSGAPIFDNGHEYQGFRGFGVIGATVDVRMLVSAPNALGARAKAESNDKAATVESGPAPGPTGPPSGASATPSERDKADKPASRPALERSPPSDALFGETRSAEIYVLRHGQSALPAASKIVPIRPGAFDVSSPQEAGETGDGSIELSKAEREAFREIARTLVGRAPVPRQEATAAAADGPAEERERPRAEFRESVPPPSADQSPAPAVNSIAGPTLRNAQTLLDHVPVGVLVADEARALYVNLTLLALLGYRDREHFDSANGLSAMFLGDVRPAMSDTDDDAVSVYTVDGQALAVEGRAQTILWDGSPATLIMLRPTNVLRSTDRRREAEGEACAAGDGSDLLEMLDLATDGAVIVDTAGRIQSFGASAERLFGYRKEEVAGESVLMLLAPGSHPAAAARLDGLARLADGPPSEQPIPVVGRERNGTALALALTLAPIGPTAARRYCALFRDIRREREAEGRLATARDAAIAASSAKTEFLAHVSHEIRTPLHAILGFAEVMMEERFGPVGNDRYRDYLKDIHASGRHVISLADDLLDISKIESGKLELAFAPVDVNNLIRECVSLMQPQAARERVIMRVSLFDRLPRVMVDERSLRQIMLNLMSNAVKFNEPGGQVILSTAIDAAGQAVIRVRDTGVGMNESEVGVALEPFGQVAGRRHKGGVGLGLPLTKALIEANKAEFSIKSRRDHGTLVEICFPIVQAAQ